MRPFLPTVGLNEYREILDLTAGHIECVLGGEFYFDLDGIVEKRLGVTIDNFELERLHFIENPTTWKVYKGVRERSFVEEHCKYLDEKFFMTSSPAIKWIKSKYGRN